MWRWHLHYSSSQIQAQIRIVQDFLSKMFLSLHPRLIWQCLVGVTHSHCPGRSWRIRICAVCIGVGSQGLEWVLMRKWLGEGESKSKIEGFRVFVSCDMYDVVRCSSLVIILSLRFWYYHNLYYIQIIIYTAVVIIITFVIITTFVIIVIVIDIVIIIIVITLVVNVYLLSWHLGIDTCEVNVLLRERSACMTPWWWLTQIILLSARWQSESARWHKMR